jgi:catechol 2,3-dioxygenase-like lactoylglutathione lyase family enzyme
MERPVTYLRHIGVAAPNFDETVDFYRDAWGLKKVEEDTGIAFFAAEGSPEQYILRIRKAEDKRIDLIALGADDAASVDRLATELAASGVRFASEPGPLQTPGGGYGFRFFDPDGRVIEVSSDVALRPYRVLEEREAVPVKLAHIVLGSEDADRAVDFYREKLGFKLSDQIVGGLCFLRCSTDHHGIAFGSVKSSKLNHVAFEMRGIHEQMVATGRLLAAGAPVQRIIGRNYFGDNVSSYFFDPNGNVSEFTAEVEQIPLEHARAPRIITPQENHELWGVQRRGDEIPENALLAEVGYWEAPPI